MKKSIAMLACLATALLNFAHAGDRFNQHEANGSDGASNFTPDEADGSKSLSMLVPDEDPRFKVADQDVQEHPMVTNDPTEFQRLLPQNQSLVHVDFSSVAGQTAPAAVEGNNFAASLNGDALVLTSYDGLPATYWFGDKAESTFVLANGSVQIVFPQDVDAASLVAADVIRSDLVESSGTHEVKAFNITMLDRNGNMTGEDRLIPQERPMFVGILSNVPFRSIIISSTSSNWTFSDLNYSAETDEYAEPVHAEQPDEKYDRPCTMNEGTCMGSEV